MKPDMSKKIRTLLYVAIGIVFLETILGIGFVLSGFMYRSFEKDKAELTLSLLKINNNERYEKIMVEQDSLARAEFYGKFQKTRNPILKTGGFLFLLFAFLHAVPAGLLLFQTMKKEDSGEVEEVKEAPKEEAKAKAEGGGGDEIEF